MPKETTQKYKKRVVIVTGGSRGIGKQIALAFGLAGDRVIINYLNHAQDARSVAEDVSRKGGEAIVFKADVRRAQELDAMINAAIARWGTVDVLVNNAGVTKDSLLLRMSEQDWEAVLDTNLKGTFYGIRAVSEIMTSQRQGHIINLASIVGLQGREGQANYAASKAGLIGLTKAAAKELGRFNIKVNAVLPGYIQTDMGAGISDNIVERIKTDNALGRINDPYEVAEFIYRLSLMNNVSGQVFNLDSRVV